MARPQYKALVGTAIQKGRELVQPLFGVKNEQTTEAGLLAQLAKEVGQAALTLQTLRQRHAETLGPLVAAAMQKSNEVQAAMGAVIGGQTAADVGNTNLTTAIGNSAAIKQGMDG